MDGSHYLSPEKQKERYLEHNNSEENQGYVEMFEGFIAAAVNPFAKKGSRVLDFGCGPGPVLAGLLSKYGYSVDTYDLFFDPNDKFQSQNYDVISLTEVLEHLNDPLETLRDLARRLNPQGVFAIMTLFHPNDQETFSKWWYRKDPTHV
jgi:2-polyprenyl-3-methyl-5-hydroxy-6-metoxy-1,4-benzoquinol methylase